MPENQEFKSPLIYAQLVKGSGAPGTLSELTSRGEPHSAFQMIAISHAHPPKLQCLSMVTSVLGPFLLCEVLQIPLLQKHIYNGNIL